MYSNDDSLSDHRSSPNMKIYWEDESVRDVNNNKNGKECSLIFSSSLTSLENVSMAIRSSVEQSLAKSSLHTVEEISIYDVRTPWKRNVLLAALAMIAFLLPFCDTIYLPVLNDVVRDLKTSNTLVALSVSIYLFMTLTIFVVASIVCIFAYNIAVLIVFRAIEGGAVSATLVVGQSLVADIYPEEKRGLAVAFFYVPFNIGPVIGPLIGGPLSQAFGWHSTFIFLSIFSFCVLLIMLIVVPETHQYFVKEHFHKANPTKHIVDAQPNELMPFRKPWQPLTYLTDSTIIPHIAVMTTTLATLYSSLTLFSTYLSAVPYSYSETIISLLFVPGGVAMFTSSILSGWLSDKASKHYGHERCPEGRLVPAIALSILHPIGLIIYGWTFHYKLNLTGPLIGFILICIGQAVLEPSISSYLTAKKQSEAGAVSAANNFVNCCAAGILVAVAIPLENAMQTGPYFSLLCGINVVSIMLAGIPVYKHIRQSKLVIEKLNGSTINQKTDSPSFQSITKF
ncbi:unnamed protein product [Rotaria magnacalcarata]|uniref:Major facilitator superfamily (MFS) profile domain-containing protein n=3 Tax=Rotaria magnacalcarata TaxID=392030 RepID=A0A814H669_9BILA|nr:unnamed protein product [Rotaria magnacalcarata]CAF3819725.1 unnamed protein product [Rotaria magnacalcarata]CAF4102719.1 unnamed protein product [Rotaria magnacalcarata]